MTSLVQEHGRQYMPCSAKFSMTLQTEILSTETSDFLKQKVFLKSFNSVLYLSTVQSNSRQKGKMLSGDSV